MAQLKGAAIVAFVAAVAVAPMQALQQHDSHHQQAMHKVGSTVTLTSCVERGQKADTFILTHTADVPVHPPTHGRVVYWLNDVKPLRDHVGHQVRVIGTITEVKQEEMEVKIGDDLKGGWYVEIEGPGPDVRAAAGKAGVSGAGRHDEKNDIKTTLVRLKVDEVAMAAESCRLK